MPGKIGATQGVKPWVLTAAGVLLGLGGRCPVQG